MGSSATSIQEGSGHLPVVADYYYYYYCVDNYEEYDDNDYGDDNYVDHDDDQSC